MSDETQAAVSPEDAQAAPDAQPGGEQPTADDIEKLLGEFDAPPKEEPRTEEVKLDPQKIAELDQFRETYAADVTNRDLATAVSIIKGTDEALEGLSDKMVRGWLEQEGREDNRLLQAFAQRHAKPDVWRSLLTAMGPRLAREVAPKTDPQLTEDREAAHAAVRNRGTAPPEEKGISNADLTKMSDRDFDAFKKQLGRA